VVSNGWFTHCNGKSFEAARSNQSAGKNALVTFAYRIMLNMNALRGREHE
jgi:hypothetical protein